MLADAAKLGDVEIPVFCYEPKLGSPVGACRMCLVEIEGIPKLQTGCSTAVKDGMVVHTQSERARTAQQAVVEFLLINHPLDCPVCDKGGECPLQDITFGWGAGRSRFIEPKRHFRKPLELSPLVAIDRERCILCYRCVRFSQEIAEDYQLVLLERGAHSFVGTFDGHPYVAPFSGNIIELCPVGALTSRPYRFRARPWEIEGAGLALHALPGAVQRPLDGARRARAARARARPRRGRRRLAVRQGPLRLPGDARRRARHRADDPRRRRAAAGLLGARARARGRWRCSARAARWPRSRAAARATRRASCSGACCARASARARSTRSRRVDPAERHRLARPELAGARHRPRVRPRRARARTASRSTTCRSSSCASARACARTASSSRSRPRAPARSTRARRARSRFAPGAARGLPAALAGALRRRGGRARRPKSSRRRAARRSMHSRSCCGDGAEEVVILYGERVLDAGRRRRAARARALALAARATRRCRERARPARRPAARANGRGLREAGVRRATGPARGARRLAGGLGAREIGARARRRAS